MFNSTKAIIVLCYAAMVASFLIGTNNLVNDKGDWLVVVNFAVSVIWGMAGSLRLAKSWSEG